MLNKILSKLNTDDHPYLIHIIATSIGLVSGLAIGLVVNTKAVQSNDMIDVNEVIDNGATQD